MYPSNPSGIGIPSPFGTAPSSIHGGNNLMDDSCLLAFNWLTQFAGQSSALQNDQPASGLKTGTNDQMNDRLFLTLDRHANSFSRLTSHSGVASGSSGSNLAMESHSGQQSDRGSVGSFLPFRPIPDGVPASPAPHHRLSNSQFAAFDSLYKAYHNAYGSGSAAANMFGSQPYRYESSLLAAEQQMLLPASLLQFPHLGMFPNAALYPNLQPGIRYPVDYYCQNMANLSLLSKYSDITPPGWPVFDRSGAGSSFVCEREKDGKDYDLRKEQQEPNKRYERDFLLEHYKVHNDREEGRRESKVEESRKEQSIGSSGNCRHHMERDAVKNEQAKRSTTLRSPTKYEQCHSDTIFNKINARQNEFSFSGSRYLGAAATEPLNLQKPLFTPGGALQQQKHTASSSSSSSSQKDRHFDLPQEYAVSKERHLVLDSKSDDLRDKQGMPPTSNLPKPVSALNSVIGTKFREQYETKFHRPFEHLHQSFLSYGNDKSEVFDRKIGILGSQRDRHHCNSKTSSAHEHKNYVAQTFSDGKNMSSENHRRLHHHHHQQRHQQQKSNDRKITPAATKRQLSETNDELPLNLVLSKAGHLDSGATGKNEIGIVRPQSNFLVQESAMGNVRNNYNKRKMGGLIQGSNLPHMDRRQKDSVKLEKTKDANHTKPLVSILNQMAMQKANILNDDGRWNSVEELDDKDSSKEVAKCLLITSGPALAAENSAQKIRFLGLFGLVTADVAREIAFNQRKERHRLMQECSTSSMRLDGGGSDVPAINITPDVVADVGCSSADKDSLLHLLQLQSVQCNCESQSNSHLELSMLPSCQNSNSHQMERSSSSSPSKCINSWSDGCSSKQKHEQLRQWMTMGTEFQNHLLTPNTCNKSQYVDCSKKQIMSDSAFAFDLNRSLQNSQLPASTSYIPQSTNYQDSCGISTAGNGGGGGGGLADAGHTHLSNSPPAKLSTRCSSSVSLSHPKEQSELSTVAELAFHWPGHEAIIESYYNYIKETSMERQLLMEQNQRLHYLNADLIQKSERVHDLMTGLLQSKERLVEDQCQLQSAIDNLNVCFKALQENTSVS